MTLTIASKYDDNETIGTSVLYGLVGMWHFDEGSGVTAHDASASANTGTLQNTPTWVAGKFVKALQFVDSGSPQYVSISDSTLPAGASAVTFVAWIKTTTVSRVDVASYGTPGGAVGRWRMLIVDESATHQLYFASYGNDCYVTATVDDGNWHQVGYIYNGGTTITFIVDGTATLTSTVAVPLNTVLTGTGYIGETGALTNTITIDEPRYYNRALSTAEVAQLYNEGAPNVVIGNETDIADIVPLSGTIGIWHLDEGTGTSTKDASKYANTGTLVNTPTWVTGRFGKALKFVTASNQYVTFSDSNMPIGSAARSMFAWVYLTAYPPAGNPAVFGYGTYGTNHSVYLLLYGSGILYFYADGNDGWTSATVPLNTWTLVGFTYAASATTVTIYIGSTGYTRSLSGGIALNTTLTGTGMIGSDPSSDPFGGTIDEVRFYNRVLSSTEITQLASEGAQSGDYVIESYVDFTSMASGDTSVITEYVSSDGYNLKDYEQSTYVGAQTAPVLRFHGKLINASQLHRVTLNQTTGIGRSYPVTSVMQVMSS